jgi:hypothetical protein
VYYNGGAKTALMVIMITLSDQVINELAVYQVYTRASFKNYKDKASKSQQLG